jgi:tetratricopeptide (TPR) repeat protein
VPNTVLRELMAEAAWTGDALARAVNIVGAEAGQSLRYGRSSVTHWLTGMCPRPPVPEFVAEAFSRKLGRPVPVADTGLGQAAEAAAALPPGLWELNVPSRLAPDGPASTARRYHLADLAVPTWEELTDRRASRSWRAETGDKIERWQVSAAASMVGLFSDTDFAFGGGHARGALTGYLATVIAPWLRATSPPAVRRDLLMTAAKLTYLCAFTHYDDELHGTAQHYYLTTLRLAAEAGDATGYAVTLRALSGQARILGHHRQAVQLAEAAVLAVAGNAVPQTKAFLFGQLAVAHAADGSRRDAIRHLITAERHLDRARDTPEPIGGCHPASLAHQQAAVRSKLGDRTGAIQALTVSVRYRPPEERRSRALTLARLAELQLDHGELEAACVTWQRFLQDYPHLRSRRLDRAFRSMRTSLRPHSANSAVVALRRQAGRRCLSA